MAAHLSSGPLMVIIHIFDPALVLTECTVGLKTVTFKIPTATPSGEYLLRIEHISLQLRKFHYYLPEYLTERPFPA